MLYTYMYRIDYTHTIETHKGKRNQTGSMSDKRK